ncbi:Nucleosome remodeling factor, subunit CAF1/NURF55/MSI1, partial [Pseudoloma neurophilia]
MQDDDSQPLLENKVILEEYKLWKKNSPYLYDMMVTHSLCWPSLSVQFFPDAVRNEKKGTTTQRLLISTHTSKKDDEFLKIMSVTIPDTVFSDEYSFDIKLSVDQQIRVEDDINRARMNYKACNIIAAHSDSQNIHIFDYTKHIKEETTFSPQIILKGHTKGGYGLSWNPLKKNILSSSGEDSLVCVFDIEKETCLQLKGHESVAGDCCFSYFSQNQLLSCGDDKNVLIWDIRNKDFLKIERAHNAEIYSLNCSPLEENIFATGSKDNSVKIWDLRKTNKEVYQLLYHKAEVLQVQFSPHFPNILASSGSDRRVCIWDIEKIGQQQTP